MATLLENPVFSGEEGEGRRARRRVMEMNLRGRNGLKCEPTTLKWEVNSKALCFSGFKSEKRKKKKNNE